MIIRPERHRGRAGGSAGQFERGARRLGERRLSSPPAAPASNQTNSTPSTRATRPEPRRPPSPRMPPCGPSAGHD